MTNPYQVLGISPSATDDEIKKAYRNLSRKFHPDANINNPNKDQAEEKFKEVQQAYDQIMKEKQQGYSYSGTGNGGGGNTYGGYGYGNSQQNTYSSSRGNETTEMRAAANYIANQCYGEALNVLNNIRFAERGSRWYYYSALANAGVGNNVTAKEHIDRAVAMEPSNMEYRQFQQHLAFGGTWYQNKGEGYERPYSSAGSWCLSMIFLNMLCNCCCLRPF